MKLELISFDLCPYVQRSAILLKHKRALFQTTYIDLRNPPEWFLKISPLGQVPVLRADDRHVIFESSVINEFIDETVGEPLHPREPLRRAMERSWIEYSSELFRSMYSLMTELDPASASDKKREFFVDLERVQPVLGDGPFFRGREFGLVDAAWAPLFVRMYLIETLREYEGWRHLKRVREWADVLIKLPEVRESLVPDFNAKFERYLRDAGSALVTNET